MATRSTDIAVVGAGAAGLSLAWRLLDPPPGVRAPDVVLVDAPPGPLRPPERTWCFWEPEHGEYDRLLTAGWRRLRVRDGEGGGAAHDLGSLRYKMLRSGDFADGLRPRLAGLARIEAVVEGVRDRPDGAEVLCRTADGSTLTLRARWVYDSRPPAVAPAARVSLLQHFRGWFVRTERPVFDTGTVELMDFRTPQPGHGLSFGYVLPTGRREALVEYTEFGRAPLSGPGYDRALRHYTERVLRLGAFRVTATEQGAIPMTDGRHPRRHGRHVFPIGAAGGAVRPSSGYAFAAIQRQTRAVARALHRGGRPEPPPAYPARSLAMDALLLHGLDSGRIAGPEFFTRLFDTVPADRLLRFLDGQAGWAEEIAVGLRTPVRAMLRTAAGLPRLSRRTPPRETAP
ncbi:lycopene cyclase family protein [Streptomyces sp. C10-9-1]|uniref:lycopene cyclase family protein n=1 Tax=Streptomyces sp. C10-9-1 TaxID=1859285 RepID=UPI002112B75B|nr:lycopene cyclase family protein [Streptomyces sp. C10-9-1]MCQ6555783.1 lycopene cyclase family protein [Streptomyces sp. C10-9-1]